MNEFSMGIRTGFDGVTTAVRRMALLVFAASALILLSLGAARSYGGDQMAETPTPRQGITQDELSVLLGYYGTASDRINTMTADAVRGLKSVPNSGKFQFLAARGAQLQNDINRIQRDLAARAGATMLRSTSESYRVGLRQAVSQARELDVVTAAEAAGQSFGFTGVDEQAVEIIARDTVARTMRTIEQHGDHAQSLLRTLGLSGELRARASEEKVNAAIVQGLILGDPKATERGVRELFRGESESQQALTYRQLGNQQITVGGWTGPVRTYARTIALTRTREATVAGRHNRLSAVGIGLVQITGRRSTNFCTDYLGLVCALNAEASEGGKYPLLASLENGGPPFHPNCSKGTAAYIPGLVSSEREADREKAMKTYEASQTA